MSLYFYRLEDLFGRYGPLVRVSMRRNYAFIEYEDIDDAEDSQSKLDGFRVHGHKMTVRFADAPGGGVSNFLPSE